MLDIQRGSPTSQSIKKLWTIAGAVILVLATCTTIVFSVNTHPENKNTETHSAIIDLLQSKASEVTLTGLAKLEEYTGSVNHTEALEQPFPETGELYHHEGFRSSSASLTIEAGNAKVPYCIKIYSGETLVSVLFIHVGQSVTTSLPSGNYTFESACGDSWFGENDLFGPEGTYKVMLFKDKDEIWPLEDGMSYTLTFSLPEHRDPGPASPHFEVF